MRAKRQISEVRIKPYPFGSDEGLVDLTLVNSEGHGLGKVVTEEDLVVLRDRIDDYIREHFPPNWETPKHWREDA